MPARVIQRRREGRPIFSLTSYLAPLTDGFDFNFAKIDRQFTSSTGPTNVVNPGDLIGLALDQRLWGGNTLSGVLGGQSELSAPGSQSLLNATGSVSGAGWNIAATMSSAQIRQTLNSSNGKIYRVSFFWSGNTNGRTIQGYLGGTSYTISTAASGSQIFYLMGTATNNILALLALNSVAGDTFYFEITSCKLILGHAALQSSSSLEPTFQTSGSKFDGINDNLLSNYFAGSGANFMVALVTVPASLAAVQAVAGSALTGGSRFRLSFNTSGNVCGAIGTQGEVTILGSNDRRNSTIVIGISNDGSTVSLFDDGTIAYVGAQSGSPNTSYPIALGSYNNNGTAANPFAGSIKRFIAGRDFLSLSRYQQIRNALLYS